jgi:hypothetical protein
MRVRLTSLAFVSLVAVAFAACGSAPLPTPATTTASSAPPPSYQPVPLGAWWAAGESTVTACGEPVTLWIAGKQLKLGHCASNLDDTATPVTLHVGEQLGIHLTSDGTQWPFPPPSPSADGIAHLVSVTDQGTTFVYQATSLGTVTFGARGLSCPASEQTYPSMVPCSFVALTVVP